MSNTNDNNHQPHFDTDMGRVFVRESIVRDVIIPEITQSNHFFPPDLRVVPKDRNKGVSTMAKYVVIESAGNRVSATVTVSVLYGIPVLSEAAHLRKKIKRAVEASTGLQVDDINLEIRSITMPDDQEEPEALPAPVGETEGQ